MHIKSVLAATLAIALAAPAAAQIPLSTYADGFEARFDRSQPVIRYVIRAAFTGAKVGDAFRVAYTRNGKPATTTVTIVPLETVRVDVVDLPTVTDRQRAVRNAWLHGPVTPVRGASE